MNGTNGSLRTRQDLIEAAAAILQPLTSCMTPGKARIYVGNGSAHYGEDVAGWNAGAGHYGHWFRC